MAKYRIDFVYNAYGNYSQNSYYIIDPDGLLTEAAIATNFDTNLGAFLCGVYQSDYRQVAIRVQRLDALPVTSPYVLVTNRPGVAGGYGLPLNCATVLRLRTGIAGRSNRGRIFYGGLAGALIGQSRVNSGDGTTLWNDRVGAIGGWYCQIPYTGAPYQQLRLHVVSKKTGTWRPVTALDYDPVVRSMRSREPGVGI